VRGAQPSLLTRAQHGNRGPKRPASRRDRQAPRLAVIRLNRSTELTGMSSRSAIWNLASRPAASLTPMTSPPSVTIPDRAPCARPASRSRPTGRAPTRPACRPRTPWPAEGASLG